MSREILNNDDFVLLGQKVPIEKKTILELEIAKLHTRTPIKVPVIVHRSKHKGPVLLLMAGVHGDETNGVAIVREIIKQKLNIPKRGTIICIPVFNVFGYLNQTREFPDGRDLNRMFPGSANGSLASQFAFLFRKEIAPYVDYVLDFHTGGAERDNAPQIRCVFAEEESFALGKIFGAPFILNSNYIHKTIRECVKKMGKTILLYEGGKSKSFDTNVIRYGVNGALNVMKSLGIQDGAIIHNTNSTEITKSKWIRSPYSGMFHPQVSNGAKVQKGEVIGLIADPYGEFDRMVKAPVNGYIICENTAPVVNKGDALFHISIELK